MKKKPLGRRGKRGDLVLLADLAPRSDPKGGLGGRTVFGERPPIPVLEEREQSASPKPRSDRERDRGPMKEGGRK